MEKSKFFKREIKSLIQELQQENSEKSSKMNSGTLSEYSHSAYVHIYNNNIETIKKLENILKRSELF